MGLFGMIIFHVINCILAMLVVMLNLNFSTQVSTELTLYLIYTLVVGVAYIIFGYKFIENTKDRLRDIVRIWCLSVFLVIMSIIDMKTASLLNLSFQPLAAVLDYRIENFDCVSMVLSFMPSLLMQVGYCFNILKEHKKN